jgi:hypothetical protein
MVVMSERDIYEVYLSLAHLAALVLALLCL